MQAASPTDAQTPVKSWNDMQHLIRHACQAQSGQVLLQERLFLGLWPYLACPSSHFMQAFSAARSTRACRGLASAASPDLPCLLSVTRSGAANFLGFLQALIHGLGPTLRGLWPCPASCICVQRHKGFQQAAPDPPCFSSAHGQHPLAEQPFTGVIMAFGLILHGHPALSCKLSLQPKAPGPVGALDDRLHLICHACQARPDQVLHFWAAPYRPSFMALALSCMVCHASCVCSQKHQGLWGAVMTGSTRAAVPVRHKQKGCCLRSLSPYRPSRITSIPVMQAVSAARSTRAC